MQSMGISQGKTEYLSEHQANESVVCILLDRWWEPLKVFEQGSDRMNTLIKKVNLVILCAVEKLLMLHALISSLLENIP